MLLFFSLYCFNGDFKRYSETGQGVIGIGDPATAKNWELERMHLLEAEIDKLNVAEILTVWPGYLLGTKTKPVPGLENQFAIIAGRELSEEKASRYKILTEKAMIRGIQEGRYPAILVNYQKSRKNKEILKAISSQYILKKDLETVKLYILRQTF